MHKLARYLSSSVNSRQKLQGSLFIQRLNDKPSTSTAYHRFVTAGLKRWKQISIF